MARELIRHCAICKRFETPSGSWFRQEENPSLYAEYLKTGYTSGYCSKSCLRGFDPAQLEILERVGRAKSLPESV